MSENWGTESSALVRRLRARLQDLREELHAGLAKGLNGRGLADELPAFLGELRSLEEAVVQLLALVDHPPPPDLEERIRQAQEAYERGELKPFQVRRRVP